MHARFVFRLLAASALLFVTTHGHAAPRDAAATQKIDEAINTHYLATEFDKAEALLKGVLDACEDRCSTSVKARSWMYVGIVRGSGRQDIAGAQEAFQQALALDPAVKLDDALATPAVKQAFDAAAAALGQPAGKRSGGGGDGGGEATGGDGAVPGNMECTPNVREVEMSRPIPVACTTDEPAAKVTLRFMAFGGEQWQQVQMTKKGEYWQGEIPCSETGVAGTLRYYVQAKDKDGEELDSHGSKKQPAEIQVVASTSEDPPSYPGQAAPPKCMSASECPEEMVGTPACPSASPGGRGSKGWGAPCDTSQECDVGLLCMQGESGRTCESAPKCDTSSDCPSGSTCKSGMCDVSGDGEDSSSPSGPYKKNIIGLHLAPDLAFLSGKDVCASTDFTCYYGTNDLYPGTIVPGNGGNINGGAAPGTVRLLASYERLLTANIGLEGRLGFAFNGGPKSADGTAFLPLHVEARAKYWFGKDVFSRRGLRPYVHLGGGMAQVDAHLNVTVRDRTLPVEQSQLTLVAYRKLGQTFITAGGGAMYAFGVRHGLLLNLNFMYMLPQTGVVIEPSLGYVFSL